MEVLIRFCAASTASNSHPYSSSVFCSRRLDIGFLAMVRLVFFFVCVAVTARCADQPPLFQLKQLAESGNPQAEFDYGTRIENSNPAECFTMVLRAAESGYGSAENWVGNYFTQKFTFTFDKTQQKQYRLRAILFTARAAYKNIPQAQSRLAGFYSTGDVLPKDPALPY